MSGCASGKDAPLQRPGTSHNLLRQLKRQYRVPLLRCNTHLGRLYTRGSHAATGTSKPTLLTLP